MQIIEKSSLKQYTSLRIGGIAQKEYLLEDINDVEQVAKFLEKDCLPHFLLGGGSNVLLDDKELDLIIVRDTIGSKEKVQIIKEDENFVYLQCYSGLYLPIFIQFCAKHGFSGLEGLIGVPGRMGGALAMNAGGFGCEIEQVFESASIFSKEFGLKTYNKHELHFAYRTFELLEKVSYFIIADMTLKLKKSTPEKVKESIQINLAKKKASQPISEKTAGSAFKNPSGNYAGKLIEEVGLKNFRINDIGFSQMHANFLVNYNNGTFSNAIEVLEIAKNKVYNETGIALQTEIKIISDKALG